MSGRYRTVALQAVAVAVLAAFVFIAFLRPTDPGDLSGIDAPGSGESPTVITPPDDGKGKRNRGERAQSGKASNGGTSSGAGGAAQLGGPVDPGEPSIPPDTGPGDDQYTDLVSALMKQVGKPGLFREIDDP